MRMARGSYSNALRSGTQLRKYVYNGCRDRNGTLKKKTPRRRSETAGAKTANETPVALTLKVDQSTYVRLCTLGATERRTNQDILRQALQEYLDRAKA